MAEAQDISAELASDISEATGGGGKPYIRHGEYYELLVTRCLSKKVKKGDHIFHRYAFMEFKVLKSKPFDKGVIPVSLQSKDDGTTPNPVGSLCSNSVNWDHPTAGMMASQNVREFICGFFGVGTDELSKDDGFRTWIDLCRREDVKAGGVDYTDPKTRQPVIAVKDKVANMGCGYVIALSTAAKENKSTRKVKDLPQEQREYFTQKNWICVAKPGTGINSPELVAKRRAEILLNMPPDMDDDEGESDLAAAGSASVPQPPQPPVSGNGHTPTPPQPPSADQNWPPVAPWQTVNDGNKSWMKPGFVWDGDKKVIPEADYRAGKR